MKINSRYRYKKAKETEELFKEISRYVKFNKLNFVLYLWLNKAGEWNWKAMIDTKPVLEVIDTKLIEALKRLAARL